MSSSSSLHAHLFSTPTPSQLFPLPHIQTHLSTSSALIGAFQTLERALGGPQAYAALTRCSRPTFSSPAVQLMTLPWMDAALVRSVGGFVHGLLAGDLGGVGESEGAVAGMWDAEKGEWRGEVLEMVAGKGKADELKRKLPPVQRRAGELPRVGTYLQERYGFAHDCSISPCA